MTDDAPVRRMLQLREDAGQQLRAGHLEQARTLANELLTLAEQTPRGWNHGNAIHHGHLILGHVALIEGDLQRASAELLAAGHTPGSPQLNSFGPNCALARDLLEAGQVEPVLEFLEACGTFWKMDFGRRSKWMRQIREKQVPDFGANLVY